MECILDKFLGNSGATLVRLGIAQQFRPVIDIYLTEQLALCALLRCHSARPRSFSLYISRYRLCSVLLKTYSSRRLLQKTIVDILEKSEQALRIFLIYRCEHLRNILLCTIYVAIVNQCVHTDMQRLSHTYKAGNAHHLVAALNLCNMLN